MSVLYKKSFLDRGKGFIYINRQQIAIEPNKLTASISILTNLIFNCFEKKKRTFVSVKFEAISGLFEHSTKIKLILYVSSNTEL